MRDNNNGGMIDNHDKLPISDPPVKVKVKNEFIVEERNITIQGDLLVAKTVADLRTLSDEHIEGLVSGKYKGVQLLGYYEEGDTPNAIIYYLSETTEPEDEGSIFEVKDIKLEHKFKIINSFIYFGVLGGDEDIDDGVRLKKLFTHASQNKINVSNQHGEYYLKETRDIPIKCNVDFGDSVFHVDESHDTSTGGRFLVLPEEDAFNITLPSGFIDELNSGAVFIDSISQYKNHYFIIENSEQYVNRDGGSTPQKALYAEMFFVGNNGTICTEISGRLNGITSCKVYPVSDATLTIKGGTFLLNAEPSSSSTTIYKRSGFTVTRSKVRFENQTVGYDEGVDFSTQINPDSGFHAFFECYDVGLYNCRGVSRSYTPLNISGTYGLGARYVTNLTLDSVVVARGDNSLGWMGGYNIKNLVVKNTQTPRIDVHYYAYNVTISNSYIDYISLVGGGRLSVDNTTVRNDYFIFFRGDYGANWDGSISIKRCKLINNSTESICRLINCRFNDFDFGLSQNLSLATSIEIDDFEFINTQSFEPQLIAIEVFGGKSITIGNNRLRMPKYISLKNLRTNTSGWIPISLESLLGSYCDEKGGIVNGDLVTNCDFIIDNVKLASNNFTLAMNVKQNESDENSWYPRFIFNGVNDVNITIGDVLAEIHLINSTLTYIRSINQNSKYFITNSSININKTGALAAGFNVYALSNNCYFTNTLWGIPKLNGVDSTSLSEINSIMANVMVFGAVNSERINFNHTKSKLTPQFETLLNSLLAPVSSDMNKSLSFSSNRGLTFILTTVGTTVQRPSSSKPVGFEYFDTTLGRPVWWNGTSWEDVKPVDATMSVKGIIEVATQTETILGTDDSRAVTPSTLHGLTATTTRKGLVNQASALANISQADLVATTSPVATVDTASTATDVAELLTDLNDLISRYNVAVALINELKTKYDLNVTLTNAIKASQNTELTNQRTAGQQAT